MSRPSLGCLLRTVRTLRPEQILGQLRRPRPGHVPPRSARGAPPRWVLGPIPAPFLPPAEHVAGSRSGRVRLLAREARFPERIDWDFGAEGPLWSYHLHQMEWLRDEGIGPDERQGVLLDWVARHRRGIGWDGGPISLRAFQWLKLLATPGALPEAADARNTLLASWADQLATLAAHRERHLLGNHYLWNLLALVLGGLVLEGGESDGWLAWEPDLLRELEAQVLADGLHEERSPMYHALLLENVLDLVNVAGATSRAASPAFEPVLRETAARMLGALEVLTHPDGAIALVSDSALGIAPPPSALRDYARALGVEPLPTRRPGVLDAGGYVRLDAGPFSLLASVAGPSPRHQPGHAHCDALSFELCLGGARVVSDTGVYEYVPGARRDASRATRSHATLEVDGHDQAELWAAHRVGGRPRVSLLEVVPGRAAEAECRGWATPQVRHRRRFEVRDREVVLRDTVEGPDAALRLSLPLAPEVACRLDGGRASLRLPDGAPLRVELPAARWRCERTPCFPSFGVERERTTLVGEARSPADLLWSFRAP